MLLGTLGTIFLGNVFAGKGINRAVKGFTMDLKDLQSSIFNFASSFNNF